MDENTSMALETDVAELTKRVEILETRLARLEVPPPMAAPMPPPPQGFNPYPQAPKRPLPPNQPHPRPGTQSGFQPPPPRPARTKPMFDTEAILKWSGLGLVALAAIFFVGTAITRGWIGPELQLAGATLVGVAMVGGAFRLERTNRPWSVALAVGGAIVLPICAAAANAALELWPNGPALVSLAVVSAALVLVARSLVIEAVAAIVAVLVVVLPFWIGEEPRLSVLVIAAWLAAVAVAYIVVGITWRWTGTRLLATVLTTVTLYLVAIGNPDPLTADDRLVATIVLAVVGLAAWAAPAVAARVNDEPRIGVVERTWRGLDQRSVLYLPVWTLAGLAAIFEFDQQETVGWIGIALAVVLALLALATRRWLTSRLFLSHLLGIGVLLTVSSMLLAGGPTLLVALVAQAAAIAVLARRFDDVLLGVYAAVLGVAAMSWGMGSMVIGIFDELTVGQHLANGSAVLLPIGLALVYRRQPRSAWFGGAVVVAWIMGLLWVASVLISLPQGQVLVSIVWAAAAAIAILLGVVRESGLARNLGLTTLAVVLLKLLTVDLAAVDTLWRVGLFFVIGSGLARLGYVLPRLGVQTPPDSTEAPTPVV